MLKIGGSLKKHNKCNMNMLLIGILIPLLIFFAVYNVTYAYFTAKTQPSEGSADSGTVFITLANPTTTHIFEAEATLESSRTYILPGDKLSICGTIENGGTTAVYILFELKVTIKKQGPSPAESLDPAFYTIVGEETQKIIETDNGDGT